MGVWAPSNTCFLGPTRVHNPKGITIGSAVFAQLKAESACTLQWALLSPKNCPFPWEIWTHIQYMILLAHPSP